MKLYVEQLIVRRGIRMVLKGVSFEVDKGDGLLITGHNGSGKTTLLRSIAGFLAPSHGKIRLEGMADEAEAADYTHYIGHLNGIKSTLTVAENLAFWASFLAHEGKTEDSVSRAAKTFALADLKHIPAGYLSAGQKRRLCLARLVLVHRPIWILDEPTVSLDKDSVDILAKEVSNHIENGGIVLAATHIPLGVKFNRSLTLIAGEIAEADGKTVQPSSTPRTEMSDEELF